MHPEKLLERKNYRTVLFQEIRNNHAQSKKEMKFQTKKKKTAISEINKGCDLSVSIGFSQ